MNTPLRITAHQLFLRPDPVAQVQFAPQVQILASLARLLRQPNSPYTLGTTIRRIVHVGHSFGSFLSAAVLATNESASLGDGLILTGFSGLFDWISLFTSGGQARVAALAFPSKWPSLSHGYLVPVDEYAAAYGGFKTPFFDHAVAKFLYDTQSPFAIGELLTAATFPLDFSLLRIPVQVCDAE